MNKINTNGWCYMPDIDRSNESIITALNNKSDIDLGNTILNDSIDPTNNKPVSGSSVYQEFLDLLGNAPETLNTLAKLAKAINNDPNFYKSLNTLLDQKAPITNPTFSGSINTDKASIHISQTNTGVHLDRSDLDHLFSTPKDTTTSVELIQVNTNENNSIRAGSLEYQLTDTDTAKLQLIMRNRKNDGWIQFGLFEDSTGSYGVAPNIPTNTDDSNKIVTSHWLRTASGDTTLNANTANSSIKAEQDTLGNVISDTYATKQELKTEVANIVNSAPETLDTLQELADALGNDPNFATTISNQIGTKANDTETVHKSGNETIAGTKTFSSTISGNVSGNSGTTTKLKTARNIAISGDASGSASFDGSKNITINTTLADSGVTEGNYGPTAATTLAFGGSFNVPQITVDAKGRSTQIVNRAIKLPAAPTTITGNAGSATKLATARTISLTGDATASGSFNGSANLALATTLAASGVTAGSYGPTANATATHGGTITIPQVTVDAKGRVTSAASRTITLPTDNNTDTKVTQTVTTTNAEYPILTTADAKKTASSTTTARFDSSITLNPGTNTITAGTFKGNLTGTSANLDTLNFNLDTNQKAYAVVKATSSLGSSNLIVVSEPNETNSYGKATAYGGNGVTIIGAGESPFTLLEELKANTSEQMYIVADTGITFYTGASTFDNKAQSTIDSAGNATFAGKVTADSFSGNATSATKANQLTTARSINGTSFNGTANITTANWGTARNITIADSDATNTGSAVSVNGSANVTLKLPSTIKATLSGNASTATTATKANQLTTARTIGISGAVTGTATSFNGTGNITIPITALDVSKATAGTLPIKRGGTGRTDGYAVNVTEHIELTSKDNIGYITQDDPSSNDVADRATLAWWNGAYSDANKSNLTYCANGTIVGTTGNQTIDGTKTFSSTIAGSINGNAATSTKLQTARTIDGISFNGSSNISHFGTCSTAAATAAKVVSCTGFTLATGARIIVKFTVTNTASSPTLNVNNTGAKAIVYRNAAFSAGTLAANRVYEFVYDGTNYELVGDINTDTNTKVTQTVTTTNAEYALLAMADASATATKTNGARFSSAVTLNPSTKKITCTGLSGTTTQTTYVGAAKSGGSLLDFPDITTGAYAPFIRYKTTNGAFVQAGYKTEFGLYYITDENIEAGTNTVTESLKFNEAGLLTSTGGFKGNLSGNASTASKATSDSLGQNIADTYIKGLSVSGTTITITKGDGGTSTIKTQDTNTDTKVTQTVTTTNAEYPILATTDAKKTSTSTTTTRFDSAITLNPGTNTITAGTFKGNLSGNASTASKAAQLTTARTIRTNLASTSTASFNGTANITPGVTGILPVANGGTGNSSGKAADSTKWNGASKTISTANPSGGANGDIWFQYIN